MSPEQLLVLMLICLGFGLLVVGVILGGDK